MDRGKAICEELKKAGINYVIWLPDSDTHFMNRAMLSDPEIEVIQVCREGEGVAICAGLHLAGKRGTLVAKNWGIFDSGDVLGWAVGLKMPMLLLLSIKPYHYVENPGVRLKYYTEPFLSTLGVPYYLVDSDEHVERVRLASEEAWKTHRPVAVLLTNADQYIAGS